MSKWIEIGRLQDIPQTIQVVPLEVIVLKTSVSGTLTNRWLLNKPTGK